MNQSTTEKLALGTSVAIIALAIWFWNGQLNSVLELLEMAYG